MTAIASDDWTPDDAEHEAARLGIPLDSEHWRVVAAVREIMAAGVVRPSLRQISVVTGVAESDIEAMFSGSEPDALEQIAGASQIERRTS